MKAVCKKCHTLLDEVEWMQIQKHTDQMDYCSECYEKLIGSINPHKVEDGESGVVYCLYCKVCYQTREMYEAHLLTFPDCRTHHNTHSMQSHQI